MRIFHRLAVLLRSWLRFGRMDTEFADELQFHLERQIGENVAAGMTPDEARRAARLSLGHVEGIREESRDARAGAIVRQLFRDTQYGARLLGKTPAFTVTAIAVVALGISATTAIFSVVYAVALRPLPYRDPDRLVALWTKYPQLTLQRVQVNGADHRDWQAGNHSFDEIALVRALANFNLTGHGEPERLFGARISASVFGVLGVAPAIGRGFIDAENQPGRDQLVILSDGLWRRRFGADRSIVGQSIRLSGVPHTIVGVMGPDFQYPGRDTQIWTPLTIDPDELSRKVPGNNYLAVARLRAGVSLMQAQQDLDAIARRLTVEFPATSGPTGVEVVPLLEDTVGGVRTTLYVMLGAVSCLLLIGCLNLANLLGARAASRAREFALRLALGASRPRLAVQAVAEVAPILAIGGVIGVAAAAWGIRAFVPFAPASLPRAENIALSVPVLLFSIAMLVVTGLVAGMVPAAQAWRADLVGAAREESRSTVGGRRQSRTRNVLVVAQIALVLPLLVGAGLFVRSFTTLMRVNPGFQSNNIQSLQLAIPRSKYPKDEEIAAFCGRVVERVAALPGVTSVAMVNRLPLAGVGQVAPLEFDVAEAVKPTISADTRTITPEYFRTMGIPLIEGRTFTDHDVETVPTNLRFVTMPTKAIIDERIARTLWPGQRALGKRFRFALSGMPWMEIIGIVGHIQHDGLDVDPRPQIYFNYLQRAQDRMALVVRAGSDPRALGPAIMQAIRDVDPEQPVYDVRTLDDVVERSTAQRWLNMMLVTAFAAIALVLASVGVFGVMSYSVARQTREFGVRLALGAKRSDVTRLVLRRGAALAGAGAALGLLGAAVVTRATAALLYGVKPSDPASFVLATVTLVSVALLASYLPARRAARVDPAMTLRGE